LHERRPGFLVHKEQLAFSATYQRLVAYGEFNRTLIASVIVDTENPNRVIVAYAAGLMRKHPKIVNALIKGLEDPTPEHRAACAFSLFGLEAPCPRQKALAALIDGLHSADPAARAASAVRLHWVIERPPSFPGLPVDHDETALAPLESWIAQHRTRLKWDASLQLFVVEEAEESGGPTSSQGDSEGEQ